MHRRSIPIWIACAFVLALSTPAVAQPEPKAPNAEKAEKKKKPDFPKFEEVSEGYEKVVSTADGQKSMYTVWKNEKTQDLLAELPRDFAKKRYFFAMTVASGEVFAGLQGSDLYAYWRRYDKRIALIQPNLEIRSTGDQESKSSVDQLFTDRVLLDIPIAAMGPGGGPVIDLDELLLGNSTVFFGGKTNGMNRKLASIESVKAFPENIEVSYEVPMRDGLLKQLHYSISVLTENPSYKPRKADARVGYFTTSYRDLGKYQDDEVRTRYINRWHLEKADPSLKLSPPKQPIVFYIEHTTPIRYRRFVRDGILSWNPAFEKVGIIDAVEVRIQDGTSGTHMDKDPEDVRYNFVRWLNNDIGTAIGPSRVNPNTGEILDADIVLTDGWIRSFEADFTKLLPELAMEGFSPETLQWLERNPSWDPRVLFSAPAEREEFLRVRKEQGPIAYGGHPMAHVDTALIGDDEYDGLVGRVSQVNGLCLAANVKAFDLAVLRTHLELLKMLPDDESGEDGEKDEDGEKKDVLDGMPAEFIGPLLADLVAHEVGHTLGLRHNFKASALYTLDEINSEKVKGKPFTASVMDYNPININMDEDAVQGDFAMVAVGPYDEWAIEYGYTFDKKLDPILAKCTHPEHAYLSDEDTSGPDPLARRYDFTKNPLDYAKNQIELANWHRSKILDRYVDDGDSWAKAREGYNMTLSLQMRATSIVANWVGGAFVSRALKGDDTEVPPVQVVPAATQRDGLTFVIENTFRDEAFGLTPELLQHLTVDKWLDEGFRAMFSEATYPVHDQVMGLQASTLSMLMNPTTLRRVYDNELRVPADEDAFTLPEMMNAVISEIWSDLGSAPASQVSPRQPAISSLRRNLQRESVSRLIDLSLTDASGSSALRTISTLARMHLGDLQGRISGYTQGASVDDYTRAHLDECAVRIQRALEAQVVTPRTASF